MLKTPNSAKQQQHAILTMLHLMDKFIEQREEQARQRKRAMVLPPRTRTPVALHRGKSMRVTAARRFPFQAKVVIHKNDRYIKGKAVDISSSGMFISADRRVFRENEKVRLYIRPDGMEKSYRAIATVVRYTDEKGRTGYGLRFSTFS